jgi:hypothetical protein
MFFLLAMEHLQLIFGKAQETSFLSKLRPDVTILGSLYADDAFVFVQLTSHDLHITDNILQIFAYAKTLLLHSGWQSCINEGSKK